MAKGGFFRGQSEPPTTYEKNERRKGTDIRRYPALLWGYICKGPHVSSVNDDIKVDFTVKYGSSIDLSEDNIEGSGYRYCEAWGYSDVSSVMAAAEMQETVVCFGEWKVTKYDETVKNKRGKKKNNFHVFTCHAVIPMSLMAFLVELYKSPTIKKILDEDYKDTPDPLEAFDDIDIGF